MRNNIDLSRHLREYPESVGVVLGAHINGLGIIRSLGKAAIPVVVLDGVPGIGMRSRYASQTIQVDASRQGTPLLTTLLDIGSQLRQKAVLYPTDDQFCGLCAAEQEKLSPYYHLTFNPLAIQQVLNKAYQYNMCRLHGIPCPATWIINTRAELHQFLANSRECRYPLIIKPQIQSQNAPSRGNRLMEILDPAHLAQQSVIYNQWMPLLISEVIPGDVSNLWAYVGCCDRSGRIIAGWTAQKISQRPFRYGTFTVIHCTPNPQITALGERVLQMLQIHGPAEVEFKWDPRTNCYVYIETNARPIQYNGLGRLIGVDLTLVDFFAATENMEALKKASKAQPDSKATMILALHELANMMENRLRGAHLMHVIRTVLGGKRMWAIHDWKDPQPSIQYLKTVTAAAWRRMIQDDHSSA